MSEDTFYFSDTHLGASSEGMELIHRSFAALGSFFRENYLTVTKAVDLGDLVECWLPEEKFEDLYRNREIITSVRGMYRNIFGERGINLTACAGNHQTHILNSNPVPEISLAHSEDATRQLADFYAEVFADSPSAGVDVFRGVKQIDENVFAHHGDFLGKKPGNRLREILGQFEEDVSLEDKMDLVNEDPEIYGKMQGVWRNFRRYLWPALALTNDRVRSVGFRLFSALTQKQGIPFHNETSLNFELLNSLSDSPEESAIVSGHLHVPNLVSDSEKGTVVHLGAWHDSHLPPAVAIKTEKQDKDLIWLVEFDAVANKWRIKSEKTI